MVAPIIALAPLIASGFERLLDKILPDPSAKAQAMLELQKEQNQQEIALLNIALQEELAQSNINLEEAKNENLFVSGWRPFIGWICGLAFMYHFILQPFMVFMYSLSGAKINLPVFDMDALFTVLMGMLGLGGLRTLEKVKGTK